jgi:hypothetical protein
VDPIGKVRLYISLDVTKGPMNAFLALQHATTVTFSLFLAPGKLVTSGTVFRGAFLRGNTFSSIMKIRYVLSQILSSVQRFLFK